MSALVSKAWEWVTGDIDSGEYDAVRVATAVGVLTSLAVWASTRGPVAVIARTPVHTAAAGSGVWWGCWIAGVIGGCALGSGRFTRVGAVLSVVALQVCGGISANWATTALLLAAMMLVFAPTRTTGAAWPLRVLQLQLPVGYLMAVLLKLTLTPEWRHLRAFRHLLTHPMNVHSWPTLPHWAAPLLDIFGLGAELGAGILLLVGLITGHSFVRKAGLLLSAMLHLGIALIVPVGLFPLAVGPLWLAHSRIRWKGGRVVWWVGAGGLVAAVAVLLGPGNPFSVL